MSSAWPLCPGSSVEDMTFLGQPIIVHRLAVPAFELVELRALRTQYGAALAHDELGPTPTGAYNCRNRRPYPETPVRWGARLRRPGRARGGDQRQGQTGAEAERSAPLRHRPKGGHLATASCRTQPASGTGTFPRARPQPVIERRRRQAASASRTVA